VTAAVKVSKGKQVLCNKVLKAKEGRGPEVQALCDTVAAFSKQRMADRAAGILAFEVSEVGALAHAGCCLCAAPHLLTRCQCCCRAPKWVMLLSQQRFCGMP
jgi:hypothetical protein